MALPADVIAVEFYDGVLVHEQHLVGFHIHDIDAGRNTVENRPGPDKTLLKLNLHCLAPADVQCHSFIIGDLIILVADRPG